MVAVVKKAEFVCFGAEVTKEKNLVTHTSGSTDDVIVVGQMWAHEVPKNVERRKVGVLAVYFCDVVHSPKVIE